MLLYFLDFFVIAYEPTQVLAHSQTGDLLNVLEKPNFLIKEVGVVEMFLV